MFLIQISHLLVWKFTDQVNILSDFDTFPYLNLKTVSLSSGEHYFATHWAKKWWHNVRCIYTFHKVLSTGYRLIVHEIKYQGKEQFFPFSSINSVLSKPEKLLDISYGGRVASPNQPALCGSITEIRVCCCVWHLSEYR